MSVGPSSIAKQKESQQREEVPDMDTDDPSTPPAAERDTDDSAFLMPHVAAALAALEAATDLLAGWTCSTWTGRRPR